jgi:hypothetical protein
MLSLHIILIFCSHLGLLIALSEEGFTLRLLLSFSDYSYIVNTCVFFANNTGPSCGTVPCEFDVFFFSRLLTF